MAITIGVDVPVDELICVTMKLPPQQLSPNARVHYMAKAKHVKLYRRLACDEAIVAGAAKKNWIHVAVQTKFWFPTNRRRDRDNLLASMKSAFDGLCDAGVIENDSGIIHMPVLCEVDPERPRVEIWIGKLAANDAFKMRLSK